MQIVLIDLGQALTQQIQAELDKEMLFCEHFLVVAHGYLSDSPQNTHVDHEGYFVLGLHWWSDRLLNYYNICIHIWKILK